MINNRQHIARHGAYLAGMSKRTYHSEEARQNLARNLDRLMTARGWSAPELEGRSGVSRRQINYMRRGTHGCSYEALGAVAGAFGLEAYQLLLPDLPDDLVDSPSLNRLIEGFANASPATRAYILEVAARASE